MESKTRITNGKKLCLLCGAVMILTGVVCVFSDITDYETLGRILIAMMLVGGVANMGIFLDLRKLGVRRSAPFSLMWLSFLFALLLVLSLRGEESDQRMVPALAGIWVLIGGMLRIVRALEMHREHLEMKTPIVGKDWNWILLFGIFEVAIGLVSFLAPDLLIPYAGLILSILLMVTGINLCIAALV